MDLYTSDERYDFEEVGTVDGRYTTYNVREYTDAEIAAGTTGSAYGSIVNDEPMLRSEYVSKGGYSFSKWGVCSVCGETYKLSDMIKVRGRYYCIPNKDYLDVV